MRKNIRTAGVAIVLILATLALLHLLNTADMVSIFRQLHGG
jgi:hypothetical protein